MQRSNILLLLVVLLLAGIGLLVWQLVQVNDRMAQLNTQVDTLGERVENAEGRASRAEADAAKARDAAQSSADRAMKAAEEAKTSKKREAESTEKARKAELARRQEELARKAAEEREELAKLTNEMNQEEIEQARQDLEATEVQLAEVEREVEAQTERARRAEAEAEAMRQRMEDELDRLQSALGKIADTRRSALGVVMTLDGSQIEFDFDQDTLRPENREVISRIAGVLMTFENYGIQIFGHTDDVGTNEYNLDLSKRRAERVRSYLAESGIDPGVMTTMGLGESEPLVQGTDDESRQSNRRVELAIVFSDAEFSSTLPADSSQ